MNKLLRITIFHVHDPKTLTATSVLGLAGIGTVSTSSHYHFTRTKLFSIEINVYRVGPLSYVSSLRE